MTKQDAPTTTDALKADFEAWHERNHYPLAGLPEEHYPHSVKHRWVAYQAGVSREAARASSAAAQPGWQMVPVKPTDPMIDAFENAMESATTYVRNFGAAYRALLEAAPPAPPAKPADTAPKETQ